MWLKATYHPVNLFSFKEINASKTAANTLLIPTPFAVKMAVVSQAIELKNIENGKKIFDEIKSADIRFKPPQAAVVSKTYGNIAYYRKQGERKHKPSFREYVEMEGNLEVALNLSAPSDLLKRVLHNIDHFGKTNSLMQCTEVAESEELDSKFSTLTPEINTEKILAQTLEDIGENTTFDQINIYDNSAKLRVGKDRVEEIHFLKVEEISSGKNYDYYKFA